MLRKATVAAALLTLTACGAAEVDIPVVEEDIVSGVKEDLDMDATVECPDQVDWETGTSFTCDVEGVEGANEAKVTMEEGDQVSWELVPTE